MEEEKTLTEMMPGVVAMSSLLAVLAQKAPDAVVLYLDLNHRGICRITAHPRSYDEIKRLLGLMMIEGEERFANHEDEELDFFAEGGKRGYELLERNTLFETSDDSLRLTLVAYERRYLETEAEYPADSIMGMIAGIKQRADEILEAEVDSTQMDGIQEEASTTEVLSALDSPAHLEHVKQLLGGG
jgi:hypothetical protein